MKVLSRTIYAVAKCEATPEFSIKFSVKDKNAVSDQLLINAAENARNKADILARASGVRLGELISIDYSWGELHLYSQTEYDVLYDAAPMLSESINIEPEDINVKDTVTFVWEILSSRLPGSRVEESSNMRNKGETGEPSETTEKVS